MPKIRHIPVARCPGVEVCESDIRIGTRASSQVPNVRQRLLGLSGRTGRASHTTAFAVQTSGAGAAGTGGTCPTLPALLPSASVDPALTDVPGQIGRRIKKNRSGLRRSDSGMSGKINQTGTPLRLESVIGGRAGIGVPSVFVGVRMWGPNLLKADYRRDDFRFVTQSVTGRSYEFPIG